ncbi:cytochrome c oxidase subunit 4 [Streptomyces sp. NPDC001793]|uniref:aa3-type cytochrome oxidase subunit IV n=1 Tax=Streptomyces sp. NPDC001793 TaxID=3154657 RepID=UPI0033279D90
MKPESHLFAGVAVFFLITDAFYIWLAREPAGAAVLAVSFGMASVISFFCAVNHRRKGERPEDTEDSAVHERAGEVDFFPPRSGYPIAVAFGVTVLALGIVYGVWVFLIGAGVTGGSVFGMVFEFAQRDH